MSAQQAALIDALDIAVDTAALAPEQVVAGAPRTGSVTLGFMAGGEVGVWEHSVGTSTDIESNEWCVIIAGTTTIELLDGDHEPLHVSAGSVVQLTAGARTKWTVIAPLRKVYFAAEV